MASPTVNVVRYSALTFGVLYGFFHNRTLRKEHNSHKLKHAVHERETLISEAKEAWKKKQLAEKDPGRSDLITDPEDPRFDLEKLLAKWETAS